MYISFFIQHYRGSFTYRGHERSLYLGTSGITTRVQDTPAAMRCLTAEQQAIFSDMRVASRLRSIKLHAHRDEPTHGCGCLFCQDAHGCIITQACSRGKGILEMQFEAIIRA